MQGACCRTSSQGLRGLEAGRRGLIGLVIYMLRGVEMLGGLGRERLRRCLGRRRNRSLRVGFGGRVGLVGLFVGRGGMVG